MVDQMLRILILEDNPADAELIQFELRAAGINFISRIVVHENDFVREIQHYCPDLILSDYDLPSYNGALALAEAGRSCPGTPFILVTGAVSEDRAIEILTQGAKDYVLKSRLEQRLVPAVRRALAEAEEHRSRKKAEEELREAHRKLEDRVKQRTAQLEAEIAARKKREAAVREREATFRSSFEAAAVGMTAMDLTGRFIMVNLAYCSMLGYSEAELLTMRF
ncbi:MAG: response regulator, partial [Deltaproteobacteria bacterium]|nr:response regulator [Deltaproteobacteria bacterium]